MYVAGWPKRHNHGKHKTFGQVKIEELSRANNGRWTKNGEKKSGECCCFLKKWMNDY
jgi:hypothetical protein